MVTPTEHFMEQMEARRSIALPANLLDFEGREELDRRVAAKEPFRLAIFYKTYVERLDLELLQEIQTRLNNKRESLGEADKRFLAQLLGLKKQDPFRLFDFVGNLTYVAEVVDELNCRTDDFSPPIKMALLQWVFVSCTEILSKNLAYFTRDWIELHQVEENKLAKSYLIKFNGGKHPALGETLFVAEKLNLCDTKEDLVLWKSRLIRNQIAHANMFYDSKLNQLVLTNGTRLPVSDLEDAFLHSYEFLLELIFQYTGGRTNLEAIFRKEFQSMSKQFQRISRSGTLRRALLNFQFDWETDS